MFFIINQLKNYSMVKRLLLLSVAAFIMVAGGFAQDLKLTQADDAVVGAETVAKPVAISIGPKVGVNFSFASDPDDIELGIKGSVGFNAGIAANLRFGKRALTNYATTGKFGVQLEVLYSYRALKSDYEDIKMNCYEIPLLFQWWFVEDFCVEVGPTFTSAMSTSPDEIVYNGATYKTGDLKCNDVMLTIGAEYKHPKGFNASARFNLGNSDLADNFQTKVSTISVAIGWLFNIVK